MNKLTNREIYDNVVKDMPQGMGGNFPPYEEVIKSNFANINMNDFIQTLCNKIGKMLYFEQHFYNAYEVLYNGSMPYGYSIEELFMESPTVIDLLENFEGGGDDIDDVFNATLPKFHGIVSNVQLIKKSKITISEKRLKSAFYSENGLSRLVITIIEEVRTTLSKEKYREIETTIEHFALGTDYNSNPLLSKQPLKVIKTTNIIKDIIKTVQDFTITSDKFNMSKVETQCVTSDIVIFVESETYSEIMSSYNTLSNGYYDIRVVNSLPKQYNSGSGSTTIEPLALIMDKRLLPVTLNYSGTEVIENPNSLELDYFYYECFNLPVNTFSNFALLVK